MDENKFDEVVSKLETVPLTKDTLQITEFSTDFEPKNLTIKDIANQIP